MFESLQSVPGDVWWEVFGRAHPVVLHTPFGVLTALLLLELWGVLRRRPLEFQTRALLVGLVMVSALVAAGSGWFLGEDPDYGGDRLVTHRNLGLGMAAVSVLMAAAAWRDMRQLYGVSLGLTLVLLLAAGHHGGSMTHGEGFLFEPLVDALGGEDGEAEAERHRAGAAARQESIRNTSAAPVPEPVTAAGTATAPVANALPILVQRCGKCHGEGRQKGGLALHDRESVLWGGDSGPSVVSGDPDASLLMQRMRLPLDHDDHMPPSSKAQPTEADVEAIAAWIAAGLPTEESPGPAPDAAPGAAPNAAPDAATGAEPDAATGAAAGATLDVHAVEAALAEPASVGALIESSPLTTGDPGPLAAPLSAPLSSSAPDAEREGSLDRALGSPSVAGASAFGPAILRLRAEQVHVETADPASGLLLVDFGARPDTSADDVARMVDDLGSAVGELSLGGTSVDDTAVASLSGLPSLERLDLSDTKLSTAGLRSLASNEHLRVLDVTGTSLDDDALESLVALPSLERLYVWDTGITPDGVQRLKGDRPGLEVIDGRGLLAEPLETEPELVLIPMEPEAMGDGPPMGAGEHTYEWAADWLQLPDGQDELGNTHGEIVIDRSGNVYLNTDTEQAVMVFGADGQFQHSWGAEFASGLHGMQLVQEEDDEFLYFVHFGRHEAVKATLDGTIVWRMGYPEASGKYGNAEQFRPTSIAVAPDGGFFVADGYGQHWVHQYDADRNWVRSIGGPGSEPGQFNTPHGVWVDTRGDVPELIVADRENHRLQRFDMQGQLLGVVEGMLRRPCKIQQRGESLVIPDLAGRVTILDGDNQLVTQLGDNPDVAKRANNGVPREEWVDGEFIAPHSAVWDASGNLYVMDWNRHGRITKLRRLP